MSESVPVSEEFYEFLESRRREGERMEETLRRLVGRPERGDTETTQDDTETTQDDAETTQDDAEPTRADPEPTGDGAGRDRNALTGPHPEEVAGIISSETAEKMRERIDRLDEADVDDKQELRERFE